MTYRHGRNKDARTHATQTTMIDAVVAPPPPPSCLRASLHEPPSGSYPSLSSRTQKTHAPLSLFCFPVGGEGDACLPSFSFCVARHAPPLPCRPLVCPPWWLANGYERKLLWVPSVCYVLVVRVSVMLSSSSSIIPDELEGKEKPQRTHRLRALPPLPSALLCFCCFVACCVGMRGGQ